MQLSSDPQYQWFVTTVLESDLDKEAEKLQNFIPTTLNKHFPKKK